MVVNSLEIKRTVSHLPKGNLFEYIARQNWLTDLPDIVQNYILDYIY